MILSAQAIPRPAFIKPTRPKDPLLRAGLAYEKKVAKLAKGLGLPVLHGQWFEYYELPSQRKFCQTDVLIAAETHILLLEVKLSQTPLGDAQLRRYSPIVSHWAKVPCIPIQVFKTARYQGEGQRPLPSLRAALALTPSSTIHTLLWRP